MIKNNSKVFIAPYSSMSKFFKDYIKKKYQLKFLGYIDNNKIGKNIYKADDINTKNFDYVFIISPNYGPKIYKHIKQTIDNSKIKIYTYENSFEEISTHKLLLTNWYQKLQINVLKIGIQYIKKYIEQKNKILFIAPQFIDINIKDLYVYLEEKSKYKLTIATNNKDQITKFSNFGFNVIYYPSWNFVYNSLLAKIKILDHSPVGKLLINSLSNSKTIQIWHGIPLKKIGHLTNYKEVNYDVLISTSDFVTDYSFANVFKYKKVINAGYPRNDILINQDVNSKNLVLVDNNIYNFIKNLNKKIILYMPTWRPDSSINNPIDLYDLNDFAKQNNIFILIKLHPLTRANSFYHSTLDTNTFNYTNNYTDNVMFYPTTNDIYPILALSDLLITDYSSVYFDYLLLDKPIIFFIYDKDIYIKTHGNFMLDINKDTPGEKIISYKILKHTILTILYTDSYKQQRNLLKDKLFYKENLGKSSFTIYKYIQHLSEEV